MNIIITVILLCTLSSFIKLFSFRYQPKYFENDDMTMMLIMCMCIHIYPFFSVEDDDDDVEDESCLHK